MWQLLAFGKDKSGATADLSADYLKRIRHYQALQLVELVPSRAQTADQRKQQEMDLLQGKCPGGSVRVCLSERGKGMDTAAFASRLQNWQDEARTVCFLIGGADGHARELEQSADVLLKLSDFTLPHMLARVLLLEQIYRGFSLNAGSPYHRD